MKFKYLTELKTKENLYQKIPMNAIVLGLEEPAEIRFLRPDLTLQYYDFPPFIHSQKDYTTLASQSNCEIWVYEKGNHELIQWLNTQNYAYKLFND